MEETNAKYKEFEAIRLSITDSKAYQPRRAAPKLNKLLESADTCIFEQKPILKYNASNKLIIIFG